MILQIQWFLTYSTSTIVNLRQLGWSQDGTLDSHANLPMLCLRLHETYPGDPPNRGSWVRHFHRTEGQLGFDERNFFWCLSRWDEIGSYGPSITTQSKQTKTNYNQPYIIYIYTNNHYSTSWSKTLQLNQTSSPKQIASPNHPTLRPCDRAPPGPV